MGGSQGVCYVLYRRGGRRGVWFLYPALLCLACAFYSYLAGPSVVFAAGVIFLCDLPYLLRHWRHLLGAVVLAALLTVPFFRYTSSQPAGVADRMASYASYWLQPLPLPEKLRRYATTYAYGLSPTYRFAADSPDLSRHEMLGYGHLWRPALPFIVLGIAVCVRRIRRPAERAFLLAGLAVPFAAGATAIGVTRVLFFVVPAALYAAIGLETAVGRLSTDPDDPPEAATVVSVTERSPNRAAQVELIVPVTPEAPPAVGFVRLEIRLLDGGDPPKIHLRELQLLGA